MNRELIVIRHGLTQWNSEKRIQGQTDIPLSAAGIAQISHYHLPGDWYQYTWFCSPLQRARQTAALLKLPVTLDEHLREMHWGEWEGHTLPALRAQYGADFLQMEQRGLDMLPPGGESPRQVQARLTGWMTALSQRQDTTRHLGAICHKGVIRALLSAACDWDMRTKPPVKLDYHCAQRFGWQQGRWRLLEINLPLDLDSPLETQVG